MNIVKQSFAEFTKTFKCVTALEYALEILPKCKETGPWVAGGALLRTYTGQPLDSDIDVFFQSKEQYEAYVSDLSLRSYKGLPEDRQSNHFIVKEMFVTEWHTTCIVNYLEKDWKIQCVTFVYFKDVAELFGSFDFDVCMWAYDGQTVHTFESTINAVTTKKISLKKINYPSVTLKRLVKYMRLGYDITDSDVLELSRSFRATKKEPKGIMDEHFGMNGGNKSEDSNYKALRNP